MTVESRVSPGGKKIPRAEPQHHPRQNQQEDTYPPPRPATAPSTILQRECVHIAPNAVHQTTKCAFTTAPSKHAQRTHTPRLVHAYKQDCQHTPSKVMTSQHHDKTHTHCTYIAWCTCTRKTSDTHAHTSLGARVQGKDRRHRRLTKVMTSYHKKKYIYIVEMT